MTPSEWKTRKTRIDAKLRPAWTIVHARNVTDTSKLARHAVEEYPTESGPASELLKRIKNVRTADNRRLHR